VVDDCNVEAAAKEVWASWSSLIFWSYARCKSERVRSTAMHVNKKTMMNDNFEHLFQKVSSV
jgi:hypothetical protein